MRPLRKYGEGEDGSDVRKTILAVGVTRYVFKDGRRTTPPEEVLKHMGLYPSQATAGEGSDIYSNPRKPSGDVFEILGSLDSLPSHFEDASSSILGHYSDL